jgi:aspergillopepsin I
MYGDSLPSYQTNGHNLYRPSKSSSAALYKGQSWSLSYTDESTASGIIYNDTVCLGSSYCVQGYTLEVANKLSNNSGVTATGSDGIIGMGLGLYQAQGPALQENYMAFSYEYGYGRSEPMF